MIKRGEVLGQSALEFSVIFGFVLFFFISFFTIIQLNIEEKNKDKEIIILQNLALNVQDEISIASKASDGYSRSFSIPNNVLGKDYVINITETLIYVKLKDFYISYKIPEVNGQIKKGPNFIRKQDGSIYLN
jgi:hypothetical protein